MNELEAWVENDDIDELEVLFEDVTYFTVVGPKGDKGNAATIKVGNVSTGAPGSDVSVTNSGTQGDAVFDFRIPRGDTGATGAPGKDGKDGTNGITPTIGTNGNWYIGNTDTGKPSRGEKGDTGGSPGADGVTPHIGDNGNWYLGTTDTGKPSRGATGAKGDTGAIGPAGPVGPQGPAGAPGKDGAGMDITGATVGQIAKIAAVDASGVPTAWSPADMPSGGGSADAVLYTAQTLTEAQQFQARKNIGAVGNDSPQFQGYLALAPANETLGSGVGLSPTGSGHNYTLDISDVDEGNPTLLTGVKTPTDADTNAATTVEYVNAKVASGGGSPDAVLYTAQTLTDAQKKQARGNVDALGPDGPVIKDMLTIGANDDSFAIAIQLDRQDNEAGENFASLNFGDNGQTGGFGVVLSGLANFGDAEAAGLEDTAVSYAQLLDYTKPLMLTYNNNQVTGASYADIRRAIERGRQIKLAVANTPDIIASNAKNETDKCVLRFIHTDVGGDAVNITQYTVAAQASGLTVNVKSHEIADGSEVSY